MWYTAELTKILDEIKETEELLREEIKSDNYDNKRLKSLVNKKERLIWERDVLISNQKDGKGK